MEPTSEQELKQLLDEGRITEEEYHELKQAMDQKNKEKPVEHERGENIPGLPHKLGKIALILALGGIVIPALCYFIMERLSPANVGPKIGPYILLFFGMELAGLVTGIISWKSGFGKAAAITAGILLLLSVKFVA